MIGKQNSVIPLGEFNIYTNLSVETIISRLRKLLEHVEVDLDIIAFEIKQLTRSLFSSGNIYERQITKIRYNQPKGG